MENLLTVGNFRLVQKELKDRSFNDISPGLNITANGIIRVDEYSQLKKKRSDLSPKIVESENRQK